MEVRRFSQKIPRDLLDFNSLLQKKASLDWETSLKKINLHENNKRRGTFKLASSAKLHEKYTTQNLDYFRDKTILILDKEQNKDEQYILNSLKVSQMKQRQKGVKFYDRISIEARESVEFRKKNILADISNEQKISVLQSNVKNKKFDLPMKFRRRASQNVNIVSELINSKVQSKSSVIEEIKCFMCHYPQQNSILLGKKVVSLAKQRLLQMSMNHAEENNFFRYQAFGYFLRTLDDLNYDSLEVITAYETVLTKYNYPVNVKLMLFYLGSYLYQLNNLYDRSEDILRKMCQQLLKLKLYEYIGVYLILMVKMKANLLEWDLCASYLMKLLAYAWLYKFQNLQIWVYFELSRSYLFLNDHQQSQYFKTRSEMNIIESATNIYRQLVAKNFADELIYMRNEHRHFNLDRKISTCELMKIESHQIHEIREREDLKLQAQIKNINQHCKIRHVKNLLCRMNSSQDIQFSRNFSKNTTFNSQITPHFAGNPLLRSHESGLKNLNIYFRQNPKGQSLINKNREPKLFTFENSNKNILVLKELCRNILLQMKFYLPINVNED